MRANRIALPDDSKADLPPHSADENVDRWVGTIFTTQLISVEQPGPENVYR
jgi:hypothetical protein